MHQYVFDHDTYLLNDNNVYRILTFLSLYPISNTKIESDNINSFF